MATNMLRKALERFVLPQVPPQYRAAWVDRRSADMQRPEAPPLALAPTWQALPGQVIELGATGFQIKLDTRPMHPLYLLVAPEGWTVLGGADLPTLKSLGERFARERTEFVFVEKQP